MSKITTVYNSLIDVTAGLFFFGRTRLHNPYDIDENPDIVKKNAWGIKVNDANPEVQQYCDLSLSRSFTLVLVRNFVSLASKEDGFDAVTIDLIEAQQSFAQVLMSPSELAQPDLIDRIDIDNISGIQELTSGEKKYLLSEVTFTITISERIV